MDKVTTVYVATHKKISFNIPTYCERVQVNCENQEQLWDGYIHDNSGDNISKKNSSYCELTVLYWAWKNSNSDIKGLCHYRRFFSYDKNDTLVPAIKSDIKHLIKDSISQKEIENVFNNNYDIILTKSYTPYPKTVYDELRKYCYTDDIMKMQEVFEEQYPDYLNTLKKILKSNNISYYNMMIAPRHIFDNYCEWVFDILEKIENKCDISKYDQQHKRLYGYLAEVLLNVYVYHNNLKIKTFKTLFLEEEKNLNKLIKVNLFRIRNKFHNKMYEIKAYSLLIAFYKVFHKNIYKRFILYKKIINNL